MQSSYKVIKGTNVCEAGKIEIDASFPMEIIKEMEIVENANTEEYTFERLRERYMEAERKSEELIADTKEKAEDMLLKAKDEVDKITYEAKENGFKSGYEEGYNIGFNEGNEKGYSESLERGEVIIQNANFILYQAKEEYDKYLKAKEMDIRSIIVSAVENMLKKEFESNDAIDELLFSILSEEKNAKMIIIRVTPTYVTELEDKLKDFKQSLGIRGEVVVLQDNLLDSGTLIVEKDNGKTSFTINNSMEKLKEILMEV